MKSYRARYLRYPGALRNPPATRALSASSVTPTPAPGSGSNPASPWAISIKTSSSPAATSSAALWSATKIPRIDSLHTYLLDFNPASTPNTLQTAALTPGTTWSDPDSLLTLTANSASNAGFNVTVGYDTACATLQYSATTFPATGGSGTVTVTAPSSVQLDRG